MADSRLVDALLRVRSAGAYPFATGWPFIEAARRGPLSRADANAYLLYCRLEFQMPTGVAERSARRLVESIATGPDGHLWESIVRVPPAEWERLCVETRIHRFATRTGRALQRIARVMVDRFEGDARRVWLDGLAATSLHNTERVLQLGPQLSRMCVLGLLETGIVTGDGDVKADVHVMRVLGRAKRGTPYTEAEAGLVQSTLASLMPADKWKLDLPLWTVGRQHCHATAPACSECPLTSACAFASSKPGLAP